MGKVMQVWPASEDLSQEQECSDENAVFVQYSVSMNRDTVVWWPLGRSFKSSVRVNSKTPSGQHRPSRTTPSTFAVLFVVLRSKGKSIGSAPLLCDCGSVMAIPNE